jgi:2-polyprenyl-3-methyl-5-hydroxy-6-metoxy-1,4-benzoquinol methylase
VALESASSTAEMRELSAEQQAQEDQYVFPYHYLDLVDDYRRYIYNAPDLCVREHIIRQLEPFSGQSILDAGCGDGRLCYDMRRQNARIVGCDYSEAALRFARAFSPEVSFFNQGLEELRTAGGFDQVLFIETLEHIEPASVSTVLENIHRVLKPGGMLVLTVPSLGLPLEKKHYQHFTKESLQEHLVPFFEEIQIGGLHLQRPLMPGSHRRAKRLAKLLFPLRKSWAFAGKAVRAYRDSYRQQCLVCEPSRGEGLIAVCKAKT